LEVIFMKLNTRLQLRYDLLSAWAAVPAADEIKLLAGEVAIGRKDDGDLVIKIGNGQGENSVWSKLPAINVTPTEFNALKDFVGTLPEGTDATTVIGYVDALNSAMDKRVAALEKVLGEGEGTVAAQIEAALNAAKAYTDAKIGTLGESETVVGLISAEKTARENADTAINNKIGTAADEATAETVYGAIAAEKARAEAAELAINNKIGTVADDKTVAQLIADEATTARAAEKANADAIAVLNGDANTAGSVAKAVADEKARAEEAEGDLGDRLTTAEGKLTTLIGTDADKSVRTIANEELAAQLLSGKADADFKTLQELAAWLEDHPEDAAAMNEAIAALQAKTVLGTYVDGEETKEYATVKAYVEAAVKAEADRATGAENALDERLDAVEAKFEGDNSVENKIAAALAEAEKYTDDEITELVTTGAVKVNTDAIAAINNETTGILAKAKEYADGLNTAMDTRVDALEATVGKAAEGENAATGLVKAVADNAAAIAAINNGTDGILAQAKAYTDELANGAVKANKEAIDAINSTTDGILVKAKAYTDQEVGKLAATVATTETLGLVKASDTVAVAEDGKMSVAKVSTDVLVQGSQEVILHGGNATGYGA
jgi:hypothetical protein